MADAKRAYEAKKLTGKQNILYEKTEIVLKELETGGMKYKDMSDRCIGIIIQNRATIAQAIRRYYADVMQHQWLSVLRGSRSIQGRQGAHRPKSSL